MRAASGGGSTAEVAWLRPGGKLLLAAGALGSPRLLLSSGIGPGAALSALQAGGALSTEPECPSCDPIDGPAGWRESPHVGAVLSDHVMARVSLRVPAAALSGGGLVTFDAADYSAAQPQLASYFAQRAGPYAQFGPTHVAYLQSPFSSEADVEVCMKTPPVAC